MTLSGVIALILHYFTKFNRCGADYVTVVEEVMSAEYRLSL